MRTKLEQFGEKFIYVILVIWLSTEVIFNSNIEYFFVWKKDDANEFFAYLILVLLLLQILLFQKYSFVEIAVILLITVPIALGTLNSNYKTLMSTWIFIVAAKHINIDKVVKVSLFSQMIMVLIVIYMFYSGMISETSFYRYSILRHSLGFTHPNQLGLRLFQLVLFHCFLRRDRIRFFDYAMVAAVAWFIKKVADSKTSYYSMIILLILMIVYTLLRRVENGHLLMAKGMIFIYIMANLGSVVLSVINVSKMPFLRTFDRMMSNRFSQCHRLYEYYGLSLFGQDIQLFVKRHIIGQRYHFWLDNAYMAILLRYGIIAFLVFSGLYLVTMIELRRTQQYGLLMILALYSIYGIMENNFFSMSQNVFLLTLAFPIYVLRDKESAQNRKKIVFTW